MNDGEKELRHAERKRRVSGLLEAQKAKYLLRFRPASLGQNCPTHCPPLETQLESLSDLLGEPLTMCEAAELIGCSVWTVRHRCIPQGLPHFRASQAGRFVFYRNQVMRWLIENQNDRRW